MKNLICYMGAVLAVLIIVFAFMTVYRESPGGELLKSYGWEFDPVPVESAELVIPEVFDEVYQSYNDLQREAGLDLEPYRGRRATRYTYIITNHPDDTFNVRGNVLVVDNIAVGGDICTVELGGFMHSLNFDLTNF